MHGRNYVYIGNFYIKWFIIQKCKIESLTTIFDFWFNKKASPKKGLIIVWEWFLRGSTEKTGLDLVGFSRPQRWQLIILIK